MALLDDKLDYQYYNNSSEFGNYQFISLKDIISNFSIAYVGDDKIIQNARKTDISFHAHRALAELSFDTFKSTKQLEITVPASLTMTLPMDYVNYTGLFWVDNSGVHHRIIPTSETSNPKSVAQNSDGSYKTSGGELLANGDFSTASHPGGFWLSGSVSYDGANNQVDFTNSPRWHKINWNNINAKVGETYTLVYTISNYSGSGTIRPQLHSTDGYSLNFTERSANGTYTETLTLIEKDHITNYPGRFWIQTTHPTNTFTGSISNVSLKANSLEYNSESSSWSSYKSITPSENANQDYNIDDDYYDLDMGGRFGLRPSNAQTNGSFYIDEVSGKVHLSSNLSGKTIVLKYISDSLGTDGEMQVHKMAEEAMYKWIAYAILSTRLSTPEYIVQRFKREKFAETRKAKLRLSNIKLEDIVQTLRNKSKFIKH